MRVIIGNIIRANAEFDLIKKNDKIAVGVSGGKDSLVLLKALDTYCKKLNKQNKWNVKVKGFHVSLNFKKVNYKPLLKWAKQNDIELEILDSNVAEVLNVKKEKDRIQCSLCSKMKKAILIKEMKKQGYKKLAFGHHADDAIETYFMNMLNESRLSTLKPISYLDRNKIYLIRPMILARERTIQALAVKLKLPIIKNMCPMEKLTQRSYMKEFIEKNFYNNPHWPNAYVNIIRSFLNKDGAYMMYESKKK